MTPSTTARLFICLFWIPLVGCGGGSGPGGTAEQTLTFGPLRVRVAGAIQSNVGMTGGGASATGVAGGSIIGMTLTDTTPTLAETRIAFVSLRDGVHEIYVMNSDGSNQTRLTNNTEVDYGPAWSPDGAKIAFWSNRDGNSEIYVMNSDGTSQMRLTNNLFGDQKPAWSPDGTKIAFHSVRDGDYEIYSMKADGTDQVRITNSPGEDFSATWSPDSTKLAFTSNRDGNYEVYSVNADGTNPVRLTTSAARDDHADWSPDSTKIAFTSLRGGSEDIYVMNSDGTSQVPLMINSVSDSQPSWSPDGAKITFASNREGPSRLFAMNSDGTAQSRLTNSTSLDAAPSWGPHITTHTLIGPGGSMGTNAAGTLFGQRSGDVKSVVTFDAVSRSSARVNVHPGTSGLGPNLVFNLSADSINRLTYINYSEAFPPAVTIIGIGGVAAAATNALVGIHADTGLVTSVLPYSASRSDSPVMTDGERVLVLRGSFLGAWNEKGVNRAPNGASEVRLDVNTGEILGVK